MARAASAVQSAIERKPWDCHRGPRMENCLSAGSAARQDVSAERQQRLDASYHDNNDDKCARDYAAAD